MEDSNVISVGIFFDGTGNNGVNAFSPDKPLKNNESYYGAFTNIYKLYNVFNGQKKIYIEGIGTVTGDEDNNFAIATCANPPYDKGYSADDKLQQADDFVQEIIDDKGKEYHFYIYGFGRGGMLARTFCNQLLTHYSLSHIKIKFLGAFDTIESKPFNNYDLSLSQEVENAFHLCGINESRFFFPLTGFFEDSRNMQDRQYTDWNTVRREIFVPGAHADVGGGYLEGPQSVYISTDFENEAELNDYISDIRNAKTDEEGNKIWDALLSDYRIESEDVFFQAFICRDKVYNSLARVYGKLMLEETNKVTDVFDADLAGFYFEIDASRHSSLDRLYRGLQEYLQNMTTGKKPVYEYEKLTDYIHISGNFGLCGHMLISRTASETNAELINNGLNVSSSTSVDEESQARLSVDLHLPEDSFVADFLYGTNVPNNDIWIRSVIKTPATVKIMK
ncbi:DUF2235 domain-containing protein [Chryseobacterium sp.]|uniref:phospholipase effector Tle1 domain-containing protein n=1 Tax=Chryseobacterium sp. TaxID=1871047 RepID=UPI0025C11DB1|nr:DUF2235 domain-containing protein [Chryseobacterium sp.]MBV8328545.1 DUF2235 domain-containing protein [Chryseobacterium sp.]